MDENKPSYLVVDTAIENVENYEEYKKLAKPIVEKFQGQYLTRGGEMDVVQYELQDIGTNLLNVHCVVTNMLFLFRKSTLFRFSCVLSDGTLNA